ncbi:MAG: hypothetical protein JSW26_06220 [Desulfobacterales bacterium]|nr:MAG: hypothetical protein JSW26_06220 [Desulfobacterales bacterium]
MQTNSRPTKDYRVITVPHGKIISLDYKNAEDRQFVREAYGYGAEEKGWFREKNRLFLFKGALTFKTATSKLSGEAPPGILDVPLPPKPDGPVSQHLLTMAESLPGSPPLSSLTVSLQGIGEVGYRLAQHLLEQGTKLIIAEPDAETCSRFKADCRSAFSSGQAFFLKKPDDIYDTPADIFCPCALRDILSPRNLTRLLKAGVRTIGGPANNLFPSQIHGPWLFHDAGLPVVPYEGIGVGGVTGVAYSVMTGIFGKCPFTISEKIKLIKAYVTKVLRWSRRYDLPPQVISDRILFRCTLRRRLLGQRQTDQLLEKLRRAFNGSDRNFEQDLVNEYTKRGLFYGAGRYMDLPIA